MIWKKYNYVLELTCDNCGKFKKWKDKGEYPNNNMNGNVLVAKSEGWMVKGCSCKCPKCKLNKSAIKRY